MMDIKYTKVEGGKSHYGRVPFGRLHLYLVLRKVELDKHRTVDIGFPFGEFHSIKLLNGKRWDTINGWNQGLRHRYFVWKSRRANRKLSMQQSANFQAYIDEMHEYRKEIQGDICEYETSIRAAR